MLPGRHCLPISHHNLNPCLSNPRTRIYFRHSRRLASSSSHHSRTWTFPAVDTSFLSGIAEVSAGVQGQGDGGTKRYFSSLFLISHKNICYILFIFLFFSSTDMAERHNWSPWRDGRDENRIWQPQNGSQSDFQGNVRQFNSQDTSLYCHYGHDRSAVVRDQCCEYLYAQGVLAVTTILNYFSTRKHLNEVFFNGNLAAKLARKGRIGSWWLQIYYSS